MSWHTDRTVLIDFVDGALPESSNSSVEAHLLACDRCRTELSDLATFPELDEVWMEVRDGVELPTPGLVERLLRRLGLAEPLAHLVGITPSLRAPWLAGVMITLIVAALAAQLTTEGNAAVFMAVAPMVPVAGVAAAFGPGVDPTYELVVAAPIRAFDLLVARSAAVLATTIPPAVALSLTLPVGGWGVVAWLAPALALTAMTLAAGTWVVPWKAGAVLLGVWITAVSVYSLGARPDASTVDLLTGPIGQMTMVGLCVVAVLVLAARRRSFELEVLR